MRRVTLYIAMSLDGYIADRGGGVDWLKGEREEAETPDVYGEFIREVDTVLMGYNTYRQVTQELSPGQWIYSDLTAYVFTHRRLDSSEGIFFTDEDPGELLERLKAEEGKTIWVCGGADLIRQLMDGDLIDQYYITVIPLLLGEGIRLFGRGGRELPLHLLRTQSYNGMTDLVYERRERP